MPFSNRTRARLPAYRFRRTARFWQRAVERRHEADIQRISICAGDGFTDFCFKKHCNAHILISVGMHGKILEEARSDGVSA